MQRLLKAPDKKNFADFRDYVLMNVLLDGMMRIGEITHVEKRDFDFKTHILTIRSSIAKKSKDKIYTLATYYKSASSRVNRRNEF
ncbi:tyrosine-type recombinase/integrase [Bacillus sp. C28GYM-DRY-1]|uniref:tyrosine-type recombinase/integrase n=1 Tax=Bacillus sp. C28GYM-DRY-1 TaxID=3062686 RepID=UPI0034A056EE